MVRGTKQPKPERQGTREARGGKEGKREFDRCERQRAEDTAAPSSCPRRTNLDRFPNVRFGSGNHRGRNPRNPTTTQRSGRGWERTSKGAQRGMPTPGRPERSGLCEDDDPGIFGYFPSLESTSPGGEISPVLLPSVPSSVSLRSPASPLRGEAYKTPPNKPSPHRGEGGPQGRMRGLCGAPSRRALHSAGRHMGRPLQRLGQRNCPSPALFHKKGPELLPALKKGSYLIGSPAAFLAWISFRASL